MSVFLNKLHSSVEFSFFKFVTIHLGYKMLVIVYCLIAVSSSGIVLLRMYVADTAELYHFQHYLLLYKYTN